MSNFRASDRHKSNQVVRGGIYKRRGRPGRKSSPVKYSTVLCKVGDGVEDLRCTENDVGITEYVGAHEGFSAVIKQRYSDFHVNEIGLDGKVVELMSLSCDIKDSAHPTRESNISISDCNDVISTEIQAKLLLLHKANYPDVEIEVTEMSKDGRKKIHEAIKNIYGNNVVSNTVDRDGKKMMIIGKPKGKQRVDDWPQGMGKYVHFVLYKENMDTMEAANIMANKLRVPVGKITYAGTKDRRAKTSQLACVPRIHPKKLSELNNVLRSLTVGNFTICPTPLRLGDLKGNRFRIVLRNVTAPDDEIKEATFSLKDKGFINYYGLQRFGSTSVPTHHIGRALLLSNWKEAVELILKPRMHVNLHSRQRKPGPSLEESLAKARQIWWETRDASSALEALGNKPRGIEGQLLMGLKRHSPNDLVNALEGIPLNTRLIYLHSYQSYVWNHVASRRLKEFGYKPIEGDLVFDEDGMEESSEVIEEVIVENEALAVDALQNEVKQEEVNDTAQDPVKSTNRSMKSQLQKVKILTQKDVESARMADIVLPLPGYDITYPNNVVATWYEEILNLDGLSSASMKQNVRKYSLRGTYRKLICHPKEFSWSSVQYSDPTIELVQSDLQKLKGEKIPDTVKDGLYKAVILDFCLPSSSYATMTLRELLKCDTSTHHQMSLNDYFGGKVGAKREGDESNEEVREVKVPRLQDEDSNCRGESAKKEDLEEVLGHTESDGKVGRLESEVVVEKIKEDEEKEVLDEEIVIGKETKGMAHEENKSD